MLPDNPLKPPSDEQYAKICSELGEDPEKFAADVQTIEKWLDSQPYFPRNYDHHIINTALRGAKLDVEKAKKKIIMFFAAKDKFPELINYKHNAQQQACMDNFEIAFIPEHTAEGYRVCWFRFRQFDPDLVDLDMYFHNIYNFTTFGIYNEHCSGGYMFFIQMDGATIEFCSKFMPVLNKLAYLIQHCLPMRVRRLVIINDNKMVSNLLNIASNILPKKIIERVDMRSPDEVITHYFDEFVPDELGGNAGTLESLCGFWTQYFKKHRDWFQHEAKVRIAGGVPKDLAEAFNFDDVFGQHGQFKHLKFDG